MDAALYPKMFACLFVRMLLVLDCIGRCRIVAPQADPDRPVLAAGDPERSNIKKCEELGGIPYHINVVNYMVSTGSDVTPSKNQPVSSDIFTL